MFIYAYMCAYANAYPYIRTSYIPVQAQLHVNVDVHKHVRVRVHIHKYVRAENLEVLLHRSSVQPKRQQLRRRAGFKDCSDLPHLGPTAALTGDMWKCDPFANQGPVELECDSEPFIRGYRPCTVRALMGG